MIDGTEPAAPDGPGRRRPRATGSVVVGAVDGVLVVALPSAVLAVAAMLVWAALGAPSGLDGFIRAAADVWLLGHGVDVRFAAPGGPFPVTVAALGPALVTAAAAIRAGRRAARAAAPVAALAGTVAGAAVASAGLLITGTSAVAAPDPVQAVLWPTLLVGGCALLALRSARRTGRAVPPDVRAGLAAAALLLAVAALALAVLIVANLSAVVGLMETLSAGVVGGFGLTVLQLLALPTLVVWAASWLLGGEVTLGAGSATGPFGAQVGPLPALPVLGAVPVDPPAAAALVLLVPVLIGFGVAALARRTGARTGAVRFGAVVGVVAGLVLGVLAAACAGSAGPGRFASVGPDGLLVAGLAALLIGLPAMLGAAVLRPPASPPDPAEEAVEAAR